MQKDYSSFINYFKRKRFGSEMPVLTILSYLSPADRCNILRALLRIDASNVKIYDKLSMALVKDGDIEGARTLLDDAKDQEILEVTTYSVLKEKIEYLNNSKENTFGSSNSYAQTIELVENGKQTLQNIGALEMCSEFNQIVLSFCNEQFKNFLR